MRELPQVLYKQNHLFQWNTPDDPLFFFFDYDERSYKINMIFQHFHPFYEVHILLDSKASHLIEGDYYNLRQHDIVLLPPSSLHKTEYPTGKPTKRLVINFNAPSSLQQELPVLGKLKSLFYQKVPIYRFPTNQQHFISYLNNIFKASNTNSPVFEAILFSNFIQFLSCIYENKDKNIYQSESYFSQTTNKIYSVTSYIHLHFHRELSLFQLAENFSISPHYLSHQFKKVTGFTLVHYIQMTRIRNAQQLLLYTTLKISDIAEKCGFTSFSQFNRVFNKYCQTSPRNFRLAKNTEKHQIPYEF